MIMPDINKLPSDNDSLELFKETLPSPSLMQVQSDERRVACRTRAAIRNSLGSSCVNVTCLALNNKKGDVGKVTSMTDEVVSSFQQEQNDNDNKKTSCLIDIGRAQETSLATDIKRHASVIADPTEQQQHWHCNQQQSTR